LIAIGFLPSDWYTRLVHMALSMSRPWKHPDSGFYWFRRRVPDDLRNLLGKREEKFSLGTRDPIEAKLISGRHRVAHDREGTPVDPGGKFLGDVWGHVVAPRMWMRH
jgi:hypothetical protein